MNEVDVPVPDLNPEGQQEAPAAQPVEQGQEVQPVETAEDFLTFKYKDHEKPIPAQAAREVAEAMGWKNEKALINALQIAADAREYYESGRQLYQAARRGVPGAQPQIPQAQPNGGYRPYGQPPQPQPTQATEEPDPYRLLTSINDQMSEFRQFVELQRQERQEAERRQLASLQREVDTEYRKFTAELVDRGIPQDKIPSRDLLLQEAGNIGMFETDIPIAEMYKRVYRMTHADDLVDFGIQRQMQALRDPRAKVTVPAPRQPAAAQPAAPTAEQLLGNMTWSEGIQFVPEARR